MGPSVEPSFEAQRAMWDWHWEHGQERRVVNAWKNRRHAAVVSFLESLRLDRPRILDVGCGTGHYTDPLARIGSVVGIDLSPRAIAEARARNSPVDYRVGNIYDAPFGEGEFDVVCAQEVFDHVPDQPRFAEMVARALRDGGHFIVSCVNRFVAERIPPGYFPKQPEAHITKPLSIRELKEVLRPRFDVLRWTSVILIGDRGLLRVTNSYRLNRAVGLLIHRRTLDALKERAGLGWHLVALARRRPR